MHTLVSPTNQRADRASIPIIALTMRLLLVLIAFIVVTLHMAADTRTTRRHLNVAEINQHAHNDSCPPSYNACPDSIIIKSYDKPLRSNRESFIVTNLHQATLSSISIKIVYREMNGEMLHSETYKIKCDIPPKETRMLYKSSWDKHQSFFYHGTRTRHRSTSARAYDVDINVVTATISQ